MVREPSSGAPRTVVPVDEVPQQRLPLHIERTMGRRDPELAAERRAFEHRILMAIANGSPSAIVAVNAGDGLTFDDLLDAVAATAVPSASFDLAARLPDGGLLLLTHGWSRRMLRARVHRLHDLLSDRAGLHRAGPALGWVFLPHAQACLTDPALVVARALQARKASAEDGCERPVRASYSWQALRHRR